MGLPISLSFSVGITEVGDSMSKTVNKKISDAVAGDLPGDSLKRMIYFTKREAEKDGRTFCAYLLDLAMSSLDENSDDLNMALRAKLMPSSLKSVN